MASNRLKTFTLTGGEDFVTPDLEIPDGTARIAFNYEQNYDTGYTRINGYRKLVSGSEPGEGPVLGTFIYNNNVYIFRNHVGGATAGLWRAISDEYDDAGNVVTPGSWVEITDIQDATGASTTIAPNGYYEFVIHNFKATARDFGVYKGDWVARTEYNLADIINDAAGDLGTIDAKYICTATHTSSNNLVDDTSFWQLINWTADAAPDDAHNITGNSGNVYGVDGKNPAFEFNGFTLKYIDTTYTPDTPMHIEATGNRLCVGFRSGEIAFSVLGLPTNFDPVLGAGSIGVTDYLTGMLAGPDGVLYIFAKNKTYLLYGLFGPLDQTELKKHNKAVGAYPYTQQMLAGHSLFFDVWGLTELQVTQDFGDVKTASLSAKIQNILLDQQPQNSVVLRDKAQYRLYFNTNTQGAGSDDTTCIIATLIRGENLGFTHCIYPFRIHTINRGEVKVGNIIEEWNIAGAYTGEVYRMDVGTSFDGAEYTSYLTLPFNYLGSPHRIKKFRKVMMTVDADDYVSLKVAADFNYGQKQQNKDVVTDIVEPSGSRWGLGIWNDFYWGTGYADYVEAYINGHGSTIAITVSSTSATDSPHTLKDLTVVYQHQRIAH